MSRDDDQHDADGLPVDPAAWDALAPHEPPAGFADRVLAARAHEARRAAAEAVAAAPARVLPRRGPWRRATLVGIVVCAAASAVFFLASGPRGTNAAGSLDALARTSVRLGTRGIAVAETGALFDWNVKGGGATVTQTRGDVFYRVEHGGAFVVTTPVGEITVKGTCFRVRLEEDPMGRDKLKGAAMGAALAAVAVVTVYEGVVKVRAQGREVTVPAGQAAKVIGGDAPRMLLDDDAMAKAAVLAAAVEGSPEASATRDELLARDQRHRDHIAALTVRLGRTERDLSEARAARRGGPGGEDERSFFDIPPEELKAMAQKCEIRYALPSFGLQAPTVSAKMAEKFALSPAQRAEMDAFLKETNDAFLKEVRALYLEVTADAAGAEALDLEAMTTEIAKKSGDDEDRRRIAEERAGMRPPSDPRTYTPNERLLRLQLALSESTYQKSKAIAGPEAGAMALSHRSVHAGCPDDEH